MINKLIIENFKIHKYLELELRNLNILTGVNSSGKSSVIQSLLLLRQSQQSGSLNVGLSLNGDYYNIGFVEDMICQYADDEYVKLSVECTENGKSYWWKFQAQDRNLQKNFIPLVDCASNDSYDINIFTDNFQYISASRWEPRETYPLDTNAVENKKQLSQKEGQCELVVHYLHHYGIEKKSKIDSRLKRESEESLSLVDQVSAWESVISSGVNVKPSKEGKAYVLKYSYNIADSIVGTKEFMATNVGFGLSYALPIIVALLTATKDSLIIIENPEAHLHPQGQSELAKLIAYTAQIGAQIIIETHSDHIINGILVATKQQENGLHGIDKDMVKLLYFHKSEKSQISNVETINILGDGKIDKQPKGFFDQIDLDLQYLLGF